MTLDSSPETAPDATAPGTPEKRRPKQRPHRTLFSPVRWASFWLYGSATLAALFVAWWALVALELVNPYFLPAPNDVLSAGVEMWKNGQLGSDTWASAQRIIIGFLLSLAIALPVGVLMGVFGRTEAALEPLIDFIRYMPAVAFVPLTIVWFGVGETQKWSIIFIGTFFQQVLMMMDSVKRTPREYVQVGETLGFDRVKLVVRIVLPASAPALWDTIRITLGWAWTWLVVAELVAAPDGLGHRILVSQRYLETDRIFFLIMWIGLIGLMLDQLIKFIGKRVFPWDTGGGR